MAAAKEDDVHGHAMESRNIYEGTLAVRKKRL